MPYVLFIKTRDGKNWAAAKGARYTTWDNPSGWMSYPHPTNVRKGYDAIRRKFANYDEMRPVSGQYVKWSDAPALLAGAIQGRPLANGPLRPGATQLAARLEAQAARIAELEAELELRRKSGSASDRLHNICEGIAKDADGSEWSREEWERLDAEMLAQKKRIAELEAQPRALRALSDEQARKEPHMREVIAQLVEALEELVMLKATRDEFSRLGSAIQTDGKAEADYARREPLAWDAARTALAAGRAALEQAQQGCRMGGSWFQRH
jgi:hypothetical protein